MIKHFDITIAGRVQGVFFRASTKRKADELGLSGFVRNEPDGTVRAEAEGDEEGLGPFVHWLHKGPPGAKVEAVATRESAVKNYHGFQVQH